MASEAVQQKMMEQQKTNKKKKKKKKAPKHPLEYVNPDDNAGPRVVPHVIEPALGLTRMFLAIMCSAMRTETLPDGGGERVVLKLHPRLAPVKVAVLPLVKNKPALVERSEALHAELSRRFSCELEVNGSIGRRYRRQDEIGTPICVTVDFDSVAEDGEAGGGGGTVTLRDRDSLKQVRVPIEEVSKATSVEELLAQF